MNDEPQDDLGGHADDAAARTFLMADMYRRAAWQRTRRGSDWVDRIFAEQGWHRGTPRGRRMSSQELAARQVAEARAARIVTG